MSKTTETLAQEIDDLAFNLVWGAKEFSDDFRASLLPILTAHELERQKEVEFAHGLVDTFHRDRNEALLENADLRALALRMRDGLRDVLSFCDASSDGETEFEKAVIAAREDLQAASAILK